MPPTHPELEAPEDGYELTRLGTHMRGAAAALADELARASGVRVWVQPVVVVWAPFPQGFVETSGVTYVHGAKLGAWLAALPARMIDATVEKVAAAIGEAAAAA